MAFQKGVKFRIYPNREQRNLIDRTLGCSRLIYNKGLAMREDAFKSGEKCGYKQTSAMLTVLKQDVNYAFLKEVDSIALQQALRNLDTGYTNFFEHRAAHPKFKSKKSAKQSYRTLNIGNGIRISNKRIRLPKIGWVKVHQSMEIGAIHNATVVRTATGKYFVVLNVEFDPQPMPNNGCVVGVDVGLKEFYSDSNGTVVNNPKYLEKKAKKLAREQRRVAAETVKQLPKLHIDYDAGTMTFNDENIDLNPNRSEVAKNIKSIQKFFSGMDYFYGDVEQAKKDYFKYMTWYLATPFMAYLRYFASRNNYDTKLFPMYGVIYGDSNGGKTTFIKFLVKLMCGEPVKMNTTEDFTATRIDGLKRVCEGLPLNIDDLAKTQFQNHSERVIKNDEWGISDRLVNYPAVSITSNKITSLTKDLSKRAIICRIGAKIDNERGAKNSKRVNESMSELTTAFYGEYVRRMLVCIDEMTTEMRENANGKEYFPDIFYASSSVIADIFEACGVDLPDYVRILYYNDYMGDESIGRAAIEKIELAWQADPSKFRVDKKQNRLIYTYPQDGPWYELKYIADELPNSLEAEISGGNQLIMNYEQAQELFGIKFRRWLGIFNL